MDKKQSRLRRSKKTRMNIREQQKARLCVHKTPRHIYAYLIDADPGKTLASASTLQKEVKEKVKVTSNIAAAELVGSVIAAKAKKLKFAEVAFDRSGFKYHGRIKALAEAAKAGGLKF